MPNLNMTVQLSVQQLADAVRHLSPEELETFELLLSEQGQELKRRIDEIERGEVKLLSIEEVFDS